MSTTSTINTTNTTNTLDPHGILIAVKRPVAPRSPDPEWNDAQRRAHEAAVAACDAWLAIGELHQRQVPLGELELAAYSLWQRVEREIAPLFAETEEGAH